MSFEVSAEAYDAFMGRYSQPLAARFLEWSDVRAGMRALDVGAGTGAATTRLVALLGAAEVSAVEPSAPFAVALRGRFPDVDVQVADAERLPYPDAIFDAAVAQLVVSFMRDPVGGLREMARVTRPGGTVSVCVWDLAGDSGPLSIFWQAAHDLDTGTVGERDLVGGREGDLTDLCHRAGLAHVEGGSLTVTVTHAGFEEWWTPFTLGVGPAGAHVAGLDADTREVLRRHCSGLLPDGPFEVTATAWCARGQA